MKDLGDLHYFLRIELIRTPEVILISQRHYVMSMLFKFGMVDCKSVSTPLDRTDKLRPDSGKVCDPMRFRQIVGSLIYLTITRPLVWTSCGNSRVRSGCVTSSAELEGENSPTRPSKGAGKEQKRPRYRVG